MTYATDLDHLVVNVGREINEAATAYERCGFQITPRGYHSLGSCNNLMIFGETYLELLGAGKGELASTALRFIEQPHGLVALALRAPDAEALHTALKADGINADAPVSFTRPVDLGERNADASFTVVRLDETVPGAGLFYCIHQTPELVWRKEWQSHPNGAKDVRAITLVANAADHEAWRSFFARGLGAARLDLLTPQQAENTFGTGTLPQHKGPHLAAITFEVDNEDATREALSASGANHENLVIPATEAYGVALKFER